jgi:hypothetical protein
LTALEVILIVVVVALAVALAWSLWALRRDRRLIESRKAMAEGHRQRVTEATATAERTQAEMHAERADATEEVARERAARHRAEAELHEARARIAAFQQERGPDDGGTQPGERRRSLFRREPDPERDPSPESERARARD